MEPIFLRRWHAFRFAGHPYVLNTDRFVWKRVSGSFPDLLRALARDPAAPVCAADRRMLFQLELVLPGPRNAPEAAADREAERLPPIGSVNLMVSQRCNQDCVYCYGDGGTYGNASTMTEEVARRSVDWLLGQADGQDRLRITFFGGEPLLNAPLIQRTLAYAAGRGRACGKTLLFSVATNGVLLDTAWIGYLESLGVHVMIGFDGPPAIQNRNRPLRRGKPSYDVVGPPHRGRPARWPGATFLRATLVRAEELPDVVEHLYRFRVAHFQTAFASSCLLDGASRSAACRPDPAAYAPYLREKVDAFLAAVRARDLEGVVTILRWLQFRAMLRRTVPGGAGTRHCGVGRSLAAVSTDGSVYPCHRFVGLRDHVVGTVDGAELRRERYACHGLFRRDPCASCWARLFCTGGCLFLNLSNTGSMLRPDPSYCQWIQSWVEAGIHVDQELSRDDRDFLSAHAGVPHRPCLLDL